MCDIAGEVCGEFSPLLSPRPMLVRCVKQSVYSVAEPVVEGRHILDGS